MQPFAAIDFETANEKRASACSIGLAVFDEKGVPTRTFHQLIKPHETLNYVNPINTWIHGIRAEDLVDAPTWGEIFPTVRTMIGDLPIVAHNLAFDGYVLRDLAGLYGHEDFPSRKLCTLRLARRLLQGRIERFGLNEVFEFFFPDEVFAHHQAEADAVAAGRIFARMQEQWGFDELDRACPPTRPRVRKTAPTATAPTATAQEPAVSIVNLINNLRKDQPLRGETVVFTGTLQAGKRSDLQKLVEELGGTAGKSTTKATTMLVVGIPNPRAWAEGAGASAKLAKATKLRESGSPIVVLSESEFFDRLGAEEAGESSE